MSSTTLETGPLLVSDLPPVTTTPRGVLDGLRAVLVARRDRRSFERALRLAGSAELSDLVAASRRS